MAKKSGVKGKPSKPTKIAPLIVTAIQNLRERKGSTPRKIIDYIGYACSMAEGRVKREVRETQLLTASNILFSFAPRSTFSQVKAALKKGVEYGILRMHRGHYYLPSADDSNRANGTAAKLGVGGAAATRRARRKPRGLGAESKRLAASRSRRVRKSRSLPFSAVTSASERSRRLTGGSRSARD